jgi:hypothetical protein
LPSNAFTSHLSQLLRDAVELRGAHARLKTGRRGRQYGLAALNRAAVVVAVAAWEAFVASRRGASGLRAVDEISAVEGRVAGRQLTRQELLNFKRNMMVNHQLEVVTEPGMVARALRAGEGAGFGVTPKGRLRIYLRPNATRYEALHEWLHFKNYSRNPQAYLRMSSLEREQFVFSRVRAYYWNSLSDAERMNALYNITRRFSGQNVLNWREWLEKWQ